MTKIHPMEAKEESHDDDFKREVLDVFADRTSLPGMGYMKDAPHLFTRIIWTLIFLGMLGASGYQLKGVIETYIR